MIYNMKNPRSYSGDVNFLDCRMKFWLILGGELDIEVVGLLNEKFVKAL